MTHDPYPHYFSGRDHYLCAPEIIYKIEYPGGLPRVLNDNNGNYYDSLKYVSEEELQELNFPRIYK